MATCRDIITRSLRRLGVLAAGEVAGAYELADGMFALQERVDMLRQLGFGELRQVQAGEDILAEAMTRIISTSASGISVTLPTQNKDQTALADGALVEIRDLNSSLAVEYRWSSDSARWEPLVALTENSIFPLGAKNEGGFIANLAIRLAGEYGVDVRPEIARDARNWMQIIHGQHEGNRPSVATYF